MTLKEMIAMLEETGFPVAYGHFPKEAPPSVPYIASHTEILSFAPNIRTRKRKRN